MRRSRNQDDATAVAHVGSARRQPKPNSCSQPYAQPNSFTHTHIHAFADSCVNSRAKFSEHPHLAHK
jgi:hypothetical protein